MDGSFTLSDIAERMKVSKSTIIRRASKEKWPFTEEKARGGAIRKYHHPDLPPDVQEALIYKEGVKPEMLPALAPSAAARALEQLAPIGMPTMSEAATAMRSSWSPETAISEQDLQNPRVRKILAILRDVDAMPRGWDKGRRKWIENVAARHDCSFQAVYRWMEKYEKRGIAGICHRKSTEGKPRAWTPEAIDWWVALCAKREHRGANRRALYEDRLLIEAARRNWSIGSYESANWWFERRWNPVMEAMQKGGLRALDNVLPPILRDYSDLEPFEILVGDQHRFNRWVVDEETGEVYRPEGYLWQDLRSRIIYGAAVDKKYDAWLIGLALRLGIACFGAFSSIYTDNGRPECSRFLMAILANLRSLGMEWNLTDDAIMDLVDIEGEDIDPHLVVPGTHRKAVVKNAKAKMIEGTFHIIEGIMASRLLLPGQTKNLADDIHRQDIDHHEALALAKQGRLLTGREFALAMYRAIDWYNRSKPHRGVKREWAWKPVPAQVTPFDCLRACYEGGWRPRMISSEASDLLFLARSSRIVDRGRVQFANEHWEHDDLFTLHKERVDIRYNPMTLDELHVFTGGRYLCTAVPVERSSMKDQDLASRKIAEKRERRKRFAEEFKRISSIAPDFREYSGVPRAEKVAALIEDNRKKRAEENREAARVLTPEELEAGVAKLEQRRAESKKRALPRRPDSFCDKSTRFQWILDYLMAGGELTPEDETFKQEYLAEQTEGQRDYYKFIMDEWVVNGRQ